MALAAVLVLWAPWRTLPPSPSVMRFTAELGLDASVSTGGGASAILSPDGKVLAFVASKAVGQKPQLYLRRLDQLQASPLAGTDGARDAFFSPDGQ